MLGLLKLLADLLSVIVMLCSMFFRMLVLMCDIYELGLFSWWLWKNVMIFLMLRHRSFVLSWFVGLCLSVLMNLRCLFIVIRLMLIIVVFSVVV